MPRNRDQDEQSEDYDDDQKEEKVQIRKPKIDRIDKFTNFKKIVINVSMTQYPVVTEVAQQLQWKIQYNNQNGDWDVFWTDFAIDPDVLIKMHLFQKINHYPGIHVIARKNLLGLGLMSLRNRFPEQYNFFPLTWMLPQQYAEFRTYYESKPKGKTRTFIAKPEAECQGRGIFLTRKIEDLQNGKHYVVQRYVAKPYLIEGLKFDMRIYVLLCGTNPMRLYVYNEGLGRLATEKYIQPTNSNLEQQYIHLTNYAINKHNPKFIFNNNANNMGIGHKRSLTCIYKQLQSKGVNITELKKKINDIIIKTIISGLPLMSHQYKCSQPEDYAGNLCFHLLGMDIMMNSKGQPLVIQVNHTPSFTTDTPLDHKIKFNLIKDTLILMNVNLKQKNQLFSKAQKINKQRLLTGKRQIFQGKERQAAIQQAQRIRDEYESKHLGGFQKIFPTDNEERMEKYKQIINFANKNYSEENGSIRMKMEEKEAKKMLRNQYKQMKRLQLEKDLTKKSEKQQKKQKIKNNIQAHQTKQCFHSQQDKKIIDANSIENIQKLSYLTKSEVKITHTQQFNIENNLVKKYSQNDKQKQKVLRRITDREKTVNSNHENQSKVSQSSYSRRAIQGKQQVRFTTPKNQQGKKQQRVKSYTTSKDIKQDKNTLIQTKGQLPNIIDSVMAANSGLLSKKQDKAQKKQKVDSHSNKIYDKIAKDLKQMMNRKGNTNGGYLMPKLISLKVQQKKQIDFVPQFMPNRKGNPFNNVYDG